MGEREATVEVRGLSHAFGVGQASVRVLHEVDLTLERGELVALMGPSGSGKTTLLTLIGCLRSVQEGSVRVLGREVAGASEPELVAMRRRLGFIFQLHNLHASLTAAENVRMGLEVHGPEPDGRSYRAACEHALALVNLADRIDFHPRQLSGGQNQRVAVARALVGNPDLVFADEPTAALDRESGTKVIDLLARLAHERGTTVLLVTHDPRILDAVDRIVEMDDGRIVAG